MRVNLALALTVLLVAAGCRTPATNMVSLKGSDPLRAQSPEDEHKSLEESPSIGRLMGPIGRRLRAAAWEEQKREAAAGGSKSITGLSDYFAAEKLYERGEYREAEKAFKQIVRDRKFQGRSWAERAVDQLRGKKQDAFDPYYSEYGDPIEEDALFMVAECRFKQKRYSWAQDSYDELIERYPSSRHLDVVTGRLFEIAQHWMGFPEVDKHGEINLASAETVANDPRKAAQGFKRPGFFNFIDRTRPVFDTAGRGLQALESIWLHDPNGPLADDALMLTANYHLRTNDYIEAARVYELLREQYPDSPHFKDAFLLDSFVRQASYDGPGYDTRPLEDALSLKESAQRLFPDLTAEQRERLKQEVARIGEAEVADEWHIVEFYQQKRDDRAVILHCNLILNKYPDSEYAARASKVLEGLADKQRSQRSRFWNPFGSRPTPSKGVAKIAAPEIESETAGDPSPKPTLAEETPAQSERQPSSTPPGRFTISDDDAPSEDVQKPPRRRPPSLLQRVLQRVEKEPDLKPVEPESASGDTQTGRASP